MCCVVFIAELYIGMWVEFKSKHWGAKICKTVRLSQIPLPRTAQLPDRYMGNMASLDKCQNTICKLCFGCPGTTTSSFFKKQEISKTTRNNNSSKAMHSYIGVIGCTLHDANLSLRIGSHWSENPDERFFLSGNRQFPEIRKWCIFRHIFAYYVKKRGTHTNALKLHCRQENIPYYELNIIYYKTYHFWIKA